ncbi:hypothetical protein [Streptomyces hiroshimensis]|uniref:Uncharacterized protein n=1 Tax=Streptomyces hiroshimensis TaxID=66424 RepID=A0ABQ2YYN3_9ACTN|nr:hypothetical protein [Streptomyces hiroshimensis]GGX97798.1 hypothetical protein GCM10010324_50070 [Streptomyces hiroshimensis]
MSGRRDKNTASREPEGWRTGPAWQEMNGKAERRRRILGGIGVAAAVAATLVALKPGPVLSRIPGLGYEGTDDRGTASHGTAAPLAPETARPSGAPGSAEGTPTLDRPFAGSPAEQYADGAAGIVVPEARPVGAFSREQVASGLKLTKDFLVAANLDPATIRGERPAAALALLDPHQDDLVTDAETALSKPSRDHDPLTLFSRFDGKEVRMVGETVKTRGRMTFAEHKDGSVAIHADYTFVYPLIKTEKGSREVVRTIVRRVLDTELLDPERFQVTPGKLAFRGYNVDIGNSACGVYDGFMHPAFHAGRLGDTAPPSGPAVDPYDRSRELDTGEAGSGPSAKPGKAGDREPCGTVTRT